MWKNSLKNVESDNSKILYKTSIFLQRNGTYFLSKSRNMSEQHSQTCSYVNVSVHHPVPCTEHMAQVLHIDSHTGTMLRVHSAFIFEFPIETHKFDDLLQLWDSTLKRVNILQVRTHFINFTGPYIPINI